jgi:UDP-N-acetylmuramoyl-L-alanyl-D-glutamate--2,6-diaminopimelate ligase
VAIGGTFNVANSLLAATVADELGVDRDAIRSGLAALPVVPGRFEIVRSPASQAVVVVDYAHTPEGLAEALTAARSIVGPGGRLTVVFGCGGDRDRDKRPAMGAVASELADLVVVTSDNPRHESPASIVDDVVAGIPADRRSTVHRELDRRGAIVGAVTAAGAGDVVVVAGKGHESTQQIGDDVVAFDDRAVARAALDQGVAVGASGDAVRS